MPLNAHDASVAVFVRGLTSLKTLLTKGEAHASATEIDPRELLDAQLARGCTTWSLKLIGSERAQSSRSTA